MGGGPGVAPGLGRIWGGGPTPLINFATSAVAGAWTGEPKGCWCAGSFGTAEARTIPAKACCWACREAS